MQWLKQSTAVTLKIGPFLDSTDGVTAETGLTVAQADVRLSKNGGNIAQKNEGTSCTHDELGIYGCPIDTTDTGTLGRLLLMVAESGALPVWHEFMVLPANTYDSLVGGSDYLQVDVHAIDSDETAANNLESYCDGSTPQPVNATQIEGSDATNQINAACDTALSDYDAPTKAELDSGLAGLNDLTAAQVNAEVDTALSDYDPPTKAELDSGLAGLNDPAASAIADAVWDEAIAGHAAGGSTGEALSNASAPTAAQVRAEIDSNSTQLAAIVADTNELQTDDVPGLIATVDANVDSILADTGTDGVTVQELKASALADLFNTDSGTDYASAAAGSVVKETADNAGGSALTEGGIADAVWDEALAGHAAGGSAGAALSSAGSGADAAAIRAEIDSNSTQLAAIVADTNELQTDDVPGLIATVDANVDSILADTGELQTDWANGGRLDLLIDAILADTGTDGVAIATATAQAIADELLKRGIDNVEDAADTLSLAAIVLATLESSISGTTWTIKKSDGTTFTTKTVTTDSGADPVIAVT